MAECNTPGKQVFKKREDAALALQNLRHIGSVYQGRIYFCRPCKGFHVTSQDLKWNNRHGYATGTLSTDPHLREVLQRLQKEKNAPQEG